MKVNDLLSQARFERAQRSSTTSSRLSNNQSTADKSSALPVSDDLEKKEPNHIENLNWINPNYRRLALQRFDSAQKISIPYIVAKQTLAGKDVFHDGAVAYSQVFLQLEDTKMFTGDGVAWPADADRTHFFCIFPGKDALTPLGTVNDLYKKGLNGAEIGIMLRINKRFEAYEQDDEDDPLMDAEWQAVSRAMFSLLGTSGEIIPKDPAAAKSIFEPLDEKSRIFSIANIMALSAGSHELTFLKIATKLGFDPDQRSRLVEATPMEHAENKGNEIAQSFLRPLLTKKAK